MAKNFLRTFLALAAAVPLTALAVQAAASETRAYGLGSRPAAKPYLSMPAREDGPMPALLSQTGAFENTRELMPAESLIPYDLVFPFWSDGASKQRWVSVPHPGSAATTGVSFSTNSEWHFPNGTVFVKHFEIALDETKPALTRRLETRLLVRGAAGAVYGVSYKWRADGSDAELLSSNLTELLTIRTPVGTRTQAWYYPSRQDCRTCHTKDAGGVLGPKTRQMNRDLAYPTGITDNQLRAWNHLGLFDPPIDEAALPALPRLAEPHDASRSLEDRARSYLDANCANCHRPGGTVAFFDARYDTPPARQGLIDGEVLFDQGLDKARVISPKDPWRSVGLLRVETLDGNKMPPLAHSVLDAAGAALLRQWILSLPGQPVLPPPSFSKPGGNYPGPVEIECKHPEPGATIHYTLDGSAPGASDPIYAGPIKLTGPTTLRAKAYKSGFTRSIAVQETYVIPN